MNNPEGSIADIWHTPTVVLIRLRDYKGRIHMPTEFTHTQNFPTDPETLFKLLANEEFILAKCAATGSLTATASISPGTDGSMTLVSTRVLPADLPGPAKSLVGDTITVTETQVWTPTDTNGSRTAQVSVEFSGPMKFEGRLQLTPTPTETTITTTGKFTASVPFIGGKIEKVAAEQTTRYLNAEERVARERL